MRCSSQSHPKKPECSVDVERLGKWLARFERRVFRNLPIPGKPLIFGVAFSERPIRFDDLTVEKTERTNANLSADVPKKSAEKVMIPEMLLAEFQLLAKGQIQMLGTSS